MAKRSKSKDMVDILAFLALIVSALCIGVVALQSAFDIQWIPGNIIHLVQRIAYGCLLLTVIFASYRYARGCSTTVRVIYFIVVVIAILGFFGYARQII